MNAYKRYCNRRDKAKIAHAFLVAEMARFQIHMVIEKPVGFNANRDERNRVRFDRALAVTRIALDTVQQISKIFSHPK